MTVIARRFRSIPERSALETWAAITELLAIGADSSSRQELVSVAGIASSLITREAMSESPIVLSGSGPRLRVYCLYGEDAITGENASEQSLAFDATSGDWHLSLPCPTDDLGWVQAALAKKNSKITARDMNDEFQEPEEKDKKTGRLDVDKGAFFRS